jgi:hypothetical protein
MLVADVTVEVVTPPRGHDHVLHQQVYLPNSTYS